MTTNYTPGPWELTQSNKCWPGYYVKHPDKIVGRVPGYFAEVRAYTSNQNTIKANALLIAAAPELLEALEELLDIEGPQPGTAAWADKTRALIAKAKGEV